MIFFIIYFIIGYIKFHYELYIMIILENIKRIRESKKLSQTEVAEQIGIAYQNYWKIENGKTELSITRLHEIAKILGVGIGELLGIESETSTLNQKYIDHLIEENKILYRKNGELYDRIDDKDSLLKRYKLDYEWLSETIGSWFGNNCFYLTALKEDIGKVDILENGKIIKTISLNTFRKDDTGTYWKKGENTFYSNGEPQNYEDPKVDFEYSFDRQDKVKIISMILNTDFFDVNFMFTIIEVCKRIEEIKVDGLQISIEPSIFEEVLQNYYKATQSAVRES